ncbi:MAG: hypothetical protein RR313_11020 [Anaerovoracaceae bacterium]
MNTTIEELKETYPLCCEHNTALFEEVCQHVLIMEEVCEKINVPLEEVVEFFYNGKIKLNFIEEQEKELRKNG